VLSLFLSPVSAIPERFSRSGQVTPEPEVIQEFCFYDLMHIRKLHKSSSYVNRLSHRLTTFYTDPEVIFRYCTFHFEGLPEQF
jgi:hypothetical protein